MANLIRKLRVSVRGISLEPDRWFRLKGALSLLHLTKFIYNTNNRKEFKCSTIIKWLHKLVQPLDEALCFSLNMGNMKHLWHGKCLTQNYVSGRLTVVYKKYSGILFSNKKKWYTDTFFNMCKACKHVKWKNPVRRPYILWFHSCEMSRIGNSTETDYWLPRKGWREWGIGSDW